MWFIGKAGAPEVKGAVCDAITRIVVSGKVAGILTLDTEFQLQCRGLGARFIATELDVSLFARPIRSEATSARGCLSGPSLQNG